MASARPFQVMATAISGQVVLNLLISTSCRLAPISTDTATETLLRIYRNPLHICSNIPISSISLSPSRCSGSVHRHQPQYHHTISDRCSFPPYSELINTWQQRLDVHICRAHLHQAGILSQLSDSFFFFFPKGKYISAVSTWQRLSVCEGVLEAEAAGTKCVACSSGGV